MSKETELFDRTRKKNEPGPSHHSGPWFPQELLKRLGSVRRRIWITTPYFVPAFPVLRVLLSAALRGREVRLILPKKPDILFVRWASAAYFAPLLKVGCRIFEYPEDVFRAKTLVVDDWALVESGHSNKRSFLFELKTDAVLQRPFSLKLLERQYASDFKKKKEIIFFDLKLRPFWMGFFLWSYLRLRRWV